MRLFRFVHDEARNNAAAACLSAPEGWAMMLAPYEQLRSYEQNAAYWAWINDFCASGAQDASGDPWTAQKLHKTLKRLHLGKFIRVLPNGDTQELEATTTRLTRKEFSGYMDQCQAWVASL